MKKFTLLALMLGSLVTPVFFSCDAALSSGKKVGRFGLHLGVLACIAALDKRPYIAVGIGCLAMSATVFMPPLIEEFEDNNNLFPLRSDLAALGRRFILFSGSGLLLIAGGTFIQMGLSGAACSVENTLGDNMPLPENGPISNLVSRLFTGKQFFNKYLPV